MTNYESNDAGQYPHPTQDLGPRFVEPEAWEQYSQRDTSKESIYPSPDVDAVPAGVDGKLSDDSEESEVSNDDVRFTVLRRSDGSLEPGWLPSGKVIKLSGGSIKREYFKHTPDGSLLTKNATDEKVASAHHEWELQHSVPQAVVEQAGKGAVSMAQGEAALAHEFDPSEDAGIIDSKTGEFLSAQEYSARYPDNA